MAAISVTLVSPAGGGNGEEEGRQSAPCSSNRQSNVVRVSNWRALWRTKSAAGNLNETAKWANMRRKSETDDTDSTSETEV